MLLREAIGIGHGEMVCLIGAGGKTTALFWLARESRQAGYRVLVTTTTKIFKPARPHVDRLFLVQEGAALLAANATLKSPVIVGAGYDVDPEGKLLGLPSKWLNEFRDSGAFDQILVEADGAASRSFKVPSEIEPVVPERCDVTVWVMSIKVLGKPLDPQWVHRAERASALLGPRPNASLTIDDIVRLVAEPEGCLRGVPPASRRVALINQADSPSEAELARQLARALGATPFNRVVISSFAAAEAVKASVVS